MSVYGTYFLLMGLYRTGHGSMANSLLLDGDSRPGQRTFSYMLRRSAGDFPSPFDGLPVGATLTTEAWNTVPWGAAAAVAIVRGVFGVTPTSPGFETFSVHPQTESMTGEPMLSGKLRLPTVRGIIQVSVSRGNCSVRFVGASAPPAKSTSSE